MPTDLGGTCLRVLRAALAADGDFWAVMHAAEALTQLGHGSEVLAALSPRLAAEMEDKRRCGLARELARAGDAARVAVLTATLADRCSTARVQAAESLFKLGLVGERDAQLEALGDGDAVLAMMAAAALIRGGDAGHLARVRACLSSADAVARRIAVWVIGQVGAAADLPALERLRSGESEPLAKCFLADALARLGSASALREVEANLAADDAAIRAYAAQTLGEAGGPDHLPTLVAMLDDADADVRVRAAQAATAILTRESQ